MSADTENVRIANIDLQLIKALSNMYQNLMRMESFGKEHPLQN